MKRIFIDQMNRKIEIDFPPKRIVSLVPSQTELLYDLGLKDEVVGQTIFCIHPDEMHKTKPRVGGTKKLHFNSIEKLKPDLIIGNKEENDQLQIEKLMKHYPVWMSDIKTLNDALDMIEKVGEMVDRKQSAIDISTKIKSGFDSIVTSHIDHPTAYLIWREPYMAAGNDTFINDMLKRCGLKNVFENELSRYPEISIDKLHTLNPKFILLSSEPYPFKQKHIEELTVICPDSLILLVDGELFSWYGSRLQKSIEYFKQLIIATQLNSK